MGLTQKLGTIPLAIQTDSSNNVGIGTATPNSYANLRTLTINGTNGSVLDFTTNGTLFGELYSLTNELRIDAVGASSRLGFFTNSIERMRITSSGNVGIGTTNPSQNTFGINRILEIGGSSVPGIVLRTTSTTGEQSILTGGDGLLISSTGSANAATDNIIRFFTGATNSSYAATERMRITSEGDICIASTAPVSTRRELRIGGNATGSRISLGKNGTNYSALVTDSGGNVYIANEYNDSAIKLLMINYNNGVYLSQSATSWTANSDERLKNINGTIENAVDKIKTLRAVNFSWKSDDNKKEVLGLIAQDVEKVFPQVIDKNKLVNQKTEVKDETEYLGVRYVELIPVLVKAIQELSAKVTALENK